MTFPIRFIAFVRHCRSFPFSHNNFYQVPTSALSLRPLILPDARKPCTVHGTHTRVCVCVCVCVPSFNAKGYLIFIFTPITMWRYSEE